MKATLYVNTKKIHFFFDIGWYSGNEFKLLSLSLISNFVERSWSLIDFQVTKFVIHIGFDILDRD
jgi:hypothetical protein